MSKWATKNVAAAEAREDTPAVDKVNFFYLVNFVLGLAFIVATWTEYFSKLTIIRTELTFVYLFMLFVYILYKSVERFAENHIEKRRGGCWVALWSLTLGLMAIISLMNPIWHHYYQLEFKIPMPAIEILVGVWFNFLVSLALKRLCEVYQKRR